MPNCKVCGLPEDLTQGKNTPGAQRELIDGAPYIKGLVCHDCDNKERAKHAVQ